MKKLMALTLVLAMVLAFGVTSSAAVGSNWTVLTPDTTYGASANGSVTDADGTIKLDAPEGAEGTQSFNQAGVCFKEAIEIDGLTLVVTPNLFNAAANGTANGWMGLTLTKTAQTAFGLTTWSDGGTYAPGIAKAETVLFGFYNNAAGDSMTITTDGPDGRNYAYTETFPAGQDATISFKVIDGKIEISVNGTAVYTTAADMDVLTDGKAYLALACVGFGYAGNTSPFVVKTINGKAANTYPEDTTVSSVVSSDTGSSDNGSSNPDTADTVVYAIAAMAVCGAVLAAGAYRAKKVK